VSRAFAECPDLSLAEVEAIKSMARSLPVVADLSRADALIYCHCQPGELIIVGEAKPWSVSAVHAEPMEGKRSDRKDEPVVFKCFDRQKTAQGHRPGTVMGATTTQDVFPFMHEGRMIAAVRGEVMVRRPDHVVIDAHPLPGFRRPVVDANVATRDQ